MLSWCGWSESKSGRSGGESFDESVSKSQSVKVHRSVRVKRVAVVVVVVARRAACDEYSRRCRSSAKRIWMSWERTAFFGARILDRTDIPFRSARGGEFKISGNLLTCLQE